jgi:predicted secreted acid phosphatase
MQSLKDVMIIGRFTTIRMIKYLFTIGLMAALALLIPHAASAQHQWLFGPPRNMTLISNATIINQSQYEPQTQSVNDQVQIQTTEVKDKETRIIVDLDANTIGKNYPTQNDNSNNNGNNDDDDIDPEDDNDYENLDSCSGADGTGIKEECDN